MVLHVEERAQVCLHASACCTYPAPDLHVPFLVQNCNHQLLSTAPLSAALSAARDALSCVLPAARSNFHFGCPNALLFFHCALSVLLVKVRGAAVGQVRLFFV